MSNQTGPTSFTGKLTSCMNHLQHGSASTSLFIKDEKPSDFLALLESAFEQFQPSSDHDAGLVTRCVHDHWVLLRRERTAATFETNLHDAKPNPADWVAVDLQKIQLFDRYKTAASRAYARSLKSLQTLLKMARDEQRWQFQLETQKQKLAIFIERFELSKQKHTSPTPPQPEEPAAAAEPAAEPDPPLATPPPPPPEQAGAVSQTLYIGTEKNKTVIYEVTPSNAKLRRTLTEDDQITRTYNFVGPVPAEYRHLLTADAYTFGKSTTVHKTYSFPEWSVITSTE